MACNNRVDGLWDAREIEYRRLDRKFENGRFLKMKIKLDYRVYNWKRFTRGNRTDRDGQTSDKKKSILTPSDLSFKARVT